MDYILRQLPGFFEGCRELYEQGNHWCLMQTIALCAEHRVPLPDWAASAYLKAYKDVGSAQAMSWDEVFGRPWPKGTHKSAAQRESKLRNKVGMRVRQILQDEPGTPIDSGLFE
jgi:hypothetical protein